MKKYSLLVLLLLASCTTQDITNNYCEKYAAADKVTISVIGSEKIYSFNNLNVPESDLKESCLNG